MNHLQKILDIEEKIKNLPAREIGFRSYSDEESAEKEVQNLVRSEIKNFPNEEALRILREFEEWGPLHGLLEDEKVSEIIVNGPENILFEKDGQLHYWGDHFASLKTFEHFIQRVMLESKVFVDLERPMVDGRFLDFRLHLLSSELTRSHAVMSLRRHPRNPWNFDRLTQGDWAEPEEIETLKRMLEQKENFLVVGVTGSGKTSVLNACLQALPQNERVVLIEDTQELSLPNGASTRLLTRKEGRGSLPPVDQMELLRQSLRMRPDRICMGEIRGPEAKDLLMALSTGHAGSFATLHAQDPQQALLRLEMLIQLGAPFWSLEAIRSLIFLSLQKIVVVGRRSDGKRRLEGIYSLASREASGILIERTA